MNRSGSSPARLLSTVIVFIRTKSRKRIHWLPRGLRLLLVPTLKPVQRRQRQAQKLLGELAEIKNRDPAAAIKSLISEEELDKIYKGVKGLMFNHSMTKIVIKNLRKVKSAKTVKTVKKSAPDKSSVHEMLAGWEKLLRDFEQKLEGSDDTPILDEAEEPAQAAEPNSPSGQIMKVPYLSYRLSIFRATMS
ncbi:uncharacterized protein RAG0_14665 [Rhynchosporium agropyri]|uniref:Uncharacterized protein n=1 Tax=Rhynchosporium agropyri TaxID=914238 RepID=A0A1E1LHW0_9HELO|nr:uncharacterized protein RAG0_14665 [Rhynchosporium agropyri]